jgi:hypothetical protein
MTDRDQVERSLASMELNGVPSNIADALRSYALDGIRPGSFTSACIANHFVDAACRAGPLITAAHLMAIAKTLYNDMPSASWGSPAKLEAWVKAGGAAGRG